MSITAAFDTTFISLKSSIFDRKLLVSSKLRNKASFHLSQMGNEEREGSIFFLFIFKVN